MGWIGDILEDGVETPRHRAPEPPRTTWAVLEVGSRLFMVIVLFGSGLVLGGLLGGLMLGCGR